MLIDEPLIVQTISGALNHGMYVTRDVKTMRQALDLTVRWQPHMAVVDIDLVDGEFLREMAAHSGADVRLPILALTRRNDLRTKLSAFELGADDVVTMPFAPDELLARMLALTRRTYGHVKATAVVRIGELEVDILNRQVRTGSSQLRLTTIEQALLYLLAANAGVLLSRDQILDAVWGKAHVPSSNIVDRHIRNLRIKLGDDWRQPRFIDTVPGQGYRLRSDG